MPFLSEVDDSLTILNRSHWEVRAGAFQLMSAAQRGVELTASKATFAAGANVVTETFGVTATLPLL